MKFKPFLTPLLVTVLAAMVLLGVRAGFSGIAKRNALAEKEAMLSFLLPESETFTQEARSGDDETIISVYKGETGYVLETKTAGYTGDIILLVGVENTGMVTGLTVRNMEETWGLGSQALVDCDFLIQFLGTEGNAQIGDGIDALTGATVTSKAIVRAVNAAVGYVTGADTSSGATSWGG